ncbi:MAG TPA: AraC family transcriptional regulator, partial [Kofleriaceae bacterium]|nr:AraC family transcriptional regulator [Kofleriaceae bacterium]
MNATSVLGVGQFYGATEERWQTELVTLTVLRHAQPRNVPHHAHEHSYFTLLLEGGYREIIGERTLVYDPLTLVFHPEGFAHRDDITVADTRFFAVEIDPSLLGPRERDELGAVHDLRGGPAVWAMLRLLETAREPHDHLDCEEPVTEILDGLLAPVPAEPPAWLERIETHLRDHAREAFSLRALADVAGVHPVHVARVFRARHGCTMRTFVQRQRVVHATRLIVAGAPLAEAALEAGFYDQSHMT